MLKITLDKKKKWKTLENSKFKFYFKGNIENIEAFATKFTFKNYKKKFDYFIKNQNFDFSIIIKSKSFILVAVDRVKSHSIFYSKKFNIISNSPEFIQKIKTTKISNKNLNEFQMAGFIQHNQTFYEDIFQLEAGSVLENINKKITYKSYYSYLNRNSNVSNYTNMLSKIIDHIFKKIIQKANGRQICIPLSGGLDSRLVLSKILELGYKNILVFSYGVKNNYDAMAKKKFVRD